MALSLLKSLKPVAGRALQIALNRALALDPDTRHALASLDGRHIDLTLEAPSLAMRISVEGDQLRVGPVDTQEADLAVRSSLAGVLAQLILSTSGALALIPVGVRIGAAAIGFVSGLGELLGYGLRIVSGRTESHVFLVDLQPMKITGKAAEAALGKAHITVNKNAIPNDPEKPFVTSGIRIGSAAMTTRGFNEADARVLANLVADVLANPEDEANLANVRKQITALCDKYPVYGA